MTSPTTAHTEIDEMQSTVADWVVRAFGVHVATNQRERGARLLEESLELTQAAGLTEAEAMRMVRYVYTRPIGELEQEIGGTAVTLMAYCHAANVSIGELAQREMDRVLAMPIEHFAVRNNMKRAMGIVAEKGGCQQATHHAIQMLDSGTAYP